MEEHKIRPTLATFNSALRSLQYLFNIVKFDQMMSIIQEMHRCGIGMLCEHLSWEFPECDTYSTTGYCLRLPYEMILLL